MVRVGAARKHLPFCVLLLLLICALPVLVQGQVLFFVTPSYPYPGPSAVADFNGDGNLDIATENLILLGNGDGTFRAGPTIGSIPQGLTVGFFAADFNGDGKPDLLIAVQDNSNNGSTTLGVYLGNGDGTFQTAINTDTGVQLYNVAVGDVNGDGKPDVVADGSGGGLWVFLGKGDGHFTPLQPNPAFTNFAPFAMGDLNGDGKLDIVTSNDGFTPSIQVWLGNGDGTFQNPITDNNIMATTLAVGDFNGDGKLDLAVVTGMHGYGLEILLGNGDGTFQAPSQQVGLNVDAMAVADFNGDGKLDIVADNQGFEQILLGNGDGTLTAGLSYVGSGNYRGIASLLVGDFNNDGKPDVAASLTSNYPNEATAVLIGNGDGSFKGPLAIPLSAAQSVAADFNGDGKPDVAAVGATVGGDVSILLNQGTGVNSITHAYPLGAGFAGSSIAAADVNGDGKIDLVVGTTDYVTTTNIGVLLGNGDGTFGSLISTQAAAYPASTQIAVGDFNGDHIPDVALIFSFIPCCSGAGAPGKLLLVMLGKGDGTFGPPTSYFAGNGTLSLAVGDFNGDGKLDIAVASSSGIGIFLGNGDGTFQAATFMGSSYVAVTVADLNGDGKLDLIAGVSPRDVPPGSLQVFLGNGDGTFKALATFGSATTSSIAVSDVNGDGKLDLIVSTAVYLGNGDGTFGVPVSFYAGPAIDPVIADFNEDGKPDIFELLPGGFYGATFFNTTPASMQLSATPLSPSTIAAGSSATSTVTVTPIFGFSGMVNLSCSISPTVTPAPTCTLPGSVQVTGGKAVQVQLMVATVAPMTTGTISWPTFPPGAAPYTWTVVLLASFILFARRRLPALAAPLVIVAFLSCAGCGGGGGSSSHTTPGTPAGTYTVTVKGSSGNFSGSVPLTVVVH
jgi:hypothetical protein